MPKVFPTPIDVLTAIGRSSPLRPIHHPVGLVLPHALGKISPETLCGIIRLAGRRIAAPSFYGPFATQFSPASVRRNLQDARTMFETVESAVTALKLDGDFTISDLTVEPEACGCEIEMPEDSFPYTVSNPVQTLEDVRGLRVPDPLKDGRMPVLVECVRLLSQRFTLLTIASACGPFTLASELLGADRAARATAKDPELLEELLEYCLEVNYRYMRSLADAGAEIIGIGEPTGVILSAATFRRFSGRYVKRLVERLNRPVVLHICGNSSHLIEEMCATGAAGISIDGRVDLQSTSARVPPHTLVIGNLDPVQVFLEMNEAQVRERTQEMLASMDGFAPFIPASGCDLSLQTPVGNVRAYLETVRLFRRGRRNGTPQHLE